MVNWIKIRDALWTIYKDDWWLIHKILWISEWNWLNIRWNWLTELNQAYRMCGERGIKWRWLDLMQMKDDVSWIKWTKWRWSCDWNRYVVGNLLSVQLKLRKFVENKQLIHSVLLISECASWISDEWIAEINKDDLMWLWLK